MKNPAKLVKERPTETAAPVATAAAVLLARIFGVDDADVIGYLAILVAFVPAAVTWTVELLRPSRTRTR